jgi:hypothetical protein
MAINYYDKTEGEGTFAGYYFMVQDGIVGIHQYQCPCEFEDEEHIQEWLERVQKFVDETA